MLYGGATTGTRRNIVGILDMSKEVGRLGDLSEWNDEGRRIAAHNSSQITDFHLSRIDEPQLLDDKRSETLARAVLNRVVSLNVEGRAEAARDAFDPAHAPFIPIMEAGQAQGLSCVSVLGRSEYLVLQGTSYSERKTWHVVNGHAHPFDEPLRAFSWSRNRLHFVMAHEDGTITIRRSLSDKPSDTIPAPPASSLVPSGLSQRLADRWETPSLPLAISRIAVSNDGHTVLVTDDIHGIHLYRKSSTTWSFDLLYPSLRDGLDLENEIDAMLTEEEEDPDYRFSPFLDMLHSALSPDGRFAAFGTQDQGHYIADLSLPKAKQIISQIGHLSEYPHDAVFDDSSERVALNSCHFYNGATVACRIEDCKGKNTPPYEVAPFATAINEYLRVYASAWLPRHLANRGSEGFLLAGAGFASCCSLEGQTLWEVDFGSSAGAIDICPEGEQIALASHSGILHVFDAKREETAPFITHFRAPHEIGRWMFWHEIGSPIYW